jgi:hypothetical protein
MMVRRTHLRKTGVIPGLREQRGMLDYGWRWQGVMCPRGCLHRGFYAALAVAGAGIGWREYAELKI